MARGLILVLVTLSGATGLVYQSLWLRSFGLVFGTTTDAIALVLAIFMGGLGLGSFLAGRRRSLSPLRDYAFVEMGIGATALVTLPLLRALPSVYAGLTSAELLVKAVSATVILLPTTVLLGATVPLVVELLDRTGSDFRAGLGRVYLFNTLGAAAGAFLVTFVLVPSGGVRASLVLAALVNIAIGGVAWRASRETKVDPPAVLTTPEPSGPGLLGGLAVVSGVFMFGIEVLWTRSFALVIGSSVYAFSSMLVAVLVGLALGTAFYDRRRARIERPERVLGALLVWTALAALVGAAAIGRLPVAMLELMKALPLTFGAHQAAALALCALTMLPVTAALGFSFPLLAHLVDRRSCSAQAGSARLYLWNTLGAIAGALLTDFLLMDRLALGLQGSFLVLSVLPLATGAWLLGAPSRPWLQPAFVAAGLLVAGVVQPWFRLWDPVMITSGVYRYGIQWTRDPRFDLSEVNSQRKLLFYREGKEAVVAVSEMEGTSLRFLSVNGKTDAGSVAEDVLTQKFIAHVPLLIHPDPRRALVIGWGSGATAASAALYPLETIECVEIEPATWEAAPLFDLSKAVRSDPRFRIVFRDGRNHLLRSRERWDVIVSEPSNPWIAGVSNLFTREFYEAARARLAPGGLIGQWFHYYNMEAADVKVELATFAAVFPHVSVWTVPSGTKDGDGMFIADLLLVGSEQPHVLQWERLRRAFDDEALARDLKSTRALTDEMAVLAGYAFSRDDLLRYVQDPVLFPRGTPLNTDDQPWIEFRAPRRNVLRPSLASQMAQAIFRDMRYLAADPLPPLRGHPGLLAGGATAAPFHVALAERWLRNGVRGRAREGFEKALALDPGNEWALESLGGLAIDDREWARAELLHRGLVKARPEDVDIRLRLAAVLARQEKWSAARDAIRAARALDPQAEVDPALVSYIEKQAGS